MLYKGRPRKFGSRSSIFHHFHWYLIFFLPFPPLTKYPSVKHDGLFYC